MDLKIFDTLLEPVFLIGSGGQIKYANPAAIAIANLSPRRILHHTLVQTLNFDPPQKEAAGELSQLVEPTPYREVAFTNLSGQTGRLQITFQRWNEDSWLVYTRDVTLEETLQKKYHLQLDQKEEIITELRSAQNQLQDYSKNLEKMVAERTLQLQSLNRSLTAMLNSLGQAFLIVQPDGICQNIFSKACETLFEKIPAQKHYADVLALENKEREGLLNWLKIVFQEPLPFCDIAPLGPETYRHSEGRNIKVEYFVIRNESAKIEALVVVGSDVTDLVAAQTQAQKIKAEADMVIKILTNKHAVEMFISESKNLLKEANNQYKKLVGQTSTSTLSSKLGSSQDSNLSYDRESLFRALHTIKGGAASFSIYDIVENCHQAETALTLNSSIKLGQKIKSVGDSFEKFLDSNELILGASVRDGQRRIQMSVQTIQSIVKVKNVGTIRQMILNQLKEPISHYFRHFEDSIRTIAENEGKIVDCIEWVNQELAIFPEPYLELFSSLSHAYRNAIDHGIELPANRGTKPRGGRITTIFRREEDWLVIKIHDDGQGIDPSKIRKKLNKADTFEDDLKVIQHIFDSEFSTREEVTETSGRGIGMNAIWVACNRLKGHCWVESKIGHFTELTIKIPWLNELKEF